MIRLFILLLHILATPLAAAPVMYAPAAQALYAGAVDGTGPQPGSAEYEAWRADTTTMAQAIGGVAGYLLSSSEAANVSAAADIAQSGFENNYLTHAEQARLEAATANCLAGDELACKQRDDIIALDLARDELLELCVGDASALCQQQRAHLALTAADWIAQAQAGNSADLSPEGVLQRHWALIQLQKHAAETDLASVVANQSAVLDLLNDGNIDTSLLDLDQISTSLGAPGVGVSDLADIFLSGDHDAINATLVVPNIMGLVVGGSQIGTGGPRPIGPRGSTGIVPEIKFPKATNTAVRPLTDAQKAGILREASNLPSGTRTLAGSATRTEASELGEAWVGPGYRVASDGKTLVSADGLRQYRPPSAKPNSPHTTTGTQANFEQRHDPVGRWTSNAHLDISD